MSGVQHKTVTQADADIRLDHWFKRHFPGLGHGALSKLLRTGQVRLDGARAKPGDRVKAGQEIRIPPLEEGAAKIPGKQKRLAKPLSDADKAFIRSQVLYEDDDVIAINKPAGLATQGGPGITRHVDGLLDAFQRDKGGPRPRLVHRLDKDTSGVLLIARNADAAAKLARIFKGRDVQKIYWALVKGLPNPPEGKIIAPMEKLPGPKGERMVVSDTGKPARTIFTLLEQAGRKAAWLALMPLTGRTHQLRLHCAYLGHPIVGDGKYGGAEAFLGGQISRKLHLHARRLILPHPDGRGTLDITAPLADHMAQTWDTFGWDKGRDDNPFSAD